MDDEQIEEDTREEGLDPNLGRVEPILELAAVEHHLQCTDSDAQGHKTEEIEGLAMSMARLANKDQDAEAGDYADRQVDVEDPAPAVILGQTAAQHRAKDRPQHDPHAPDRDCLPVPLRR